MAQKISVDAATAAALAKMLREPHYELIPLKGMMDAAAHLPPGAVVSVTASPNLGMDHTVAAAVDLAALGLSVMPHFSARLTRNEAQLAELLERVADAGITRVLVVGGDSEQTGDFRNGLALLEAMDAIGHPFTEVGVPAYPEGHPHIPDQVLAADLLAKQRHATFMTTQMCFDADAITGWLAAMRSNGVDLPVFVGVPGVAPLHRLAAISARIGIGQSVRYLAKQHGLVGSLLRPGRYTPDELLVGLGLGDGSVTGLRGLHIFTFNQVETTEEWRTDLLAALAG